MDDNRDFLPSRSFEEDEIDLVEIAEKIWSKKYSIFFVGIFFAISSFIFILVKYPQIIETSSIVSLNFKGIEKHLNPDESLFEEEQLITPSLLSTVYNDIDFSNEFSVNDLMSSVDVDPYIPEEIQKRLNDRKTDNDFKYFPNNFYINLKSEREDIFKGTENREKIIKGIVDEYRKAFVNDYLKIESVKIKFDEDIYKNDFRDLVEILEKNLNTLEEFIELQIEKYGNYNSNRFKTNFGIILKNLKILRENDLGNIRSLIGVRNLTKFKDIELDKLEYKIDEIALKRKAKEIEYKGIEDLLSKLSEQRNVPKRFNGTDTAISLDQSFIDSLIEKDPYSFLVKKASEISSELSKLVVAENNLIKIRKELLAKSEISESNINFIQKKLELIGKKIEGQSAVISLLNEECMGKRFANLIQLVRQPQTIERRDVNVKMIVLLAGFAGLVFGIFWVLLVGAFRKTE